MTKSKVEEMPLEQFIELLKELKCDRLVTGSPGQPDVIYTLTNKKVEE